MAEEPRLKIIAVDDDESILEMYDAVISPIHDIQTFSSPQLAKKFLDSVGPAEVPDVILMDLMMPGISGIVLMNHIHSMPNTAHVPVIAISAKCDEATVKDALLFGAVDFIAKPFEFLTLRASIKKAYDANR